MKNLLWLAIALVVTSCNRPGTDTVTTQTESEPSYLADSLYRYHGYTGKLTGFEKEELKTIDSNTVKFLHAKTEGFSADYWWVRSYHYFSKQRKTGGFQPIIVRETGDDYWAYIMFILNDKNEVVSSKEIQGGDYTGPDNYKDRMELESNFCDIRNEHRIDFFRIKEIYPTIDSDHVTDNPTMHDSISYIININNEGQFETKYLDSVRVMNK